MNADPAIIINRVASSFGVRPEDLLKGRLRREPIGTARKVAKVLVFSSVGDQGEVGRIFGCHPSTVSYSVHHTDARMVEAVRLGKRVDLGLARDRNGEGSPGRTRPTGRCECGNPASKRKFGYWVCDRCDRIEKRLWADFADTKR